MKTRANCLVVVTLGHTCVVIFNMGRAEYMCDYV